MKRLILIMVVVSQCIATFSQAQTPKKKSFLQIIGEAAKRAAKDHINTMLQLDTVQNHGSQNQDVLRGAPSGQAQQVDWNTGNQSGGLKQVDWNTGNQSGGVKQVDWNTGNQSGGLKQVDWNTGNKSGGVKQVDWNTGNQSGGVKQVDWNTGPSGNVKEIDWNTGNQSGGVKQVDWNTENAQGGVKQVDWNTENAQGGIKTVDWDMGNSRGVVMPVDWDVINKQSKVQSVDMKSTPLGNSQPADINYSPSGFENVAYFADLNLGKIAQNDIYEKQIYPKVEKAVYFIIEQTATWMIKTEIFAITKADKSIIYAFKGINYLKEGLTLATPYYKGEKSIMNIFKKD